MPTITRAFMHQYFLERLELPDPSERIAALEALATRDDEPVLRLEATVRLLADPAPGVREQAARVMAGLAGPAAAAATAPLIGHPDIAVRNLAGEVLAAMGKPAVEVLRGYLGHTDKDVRKFALDVLAQLPAQPAAPYIALCLADPDPNVVLAAIDALGRLRATAYGRDLRSLYKRLPLARPSIVAALGGFGNPEAGRFLEEALDDPDPVVQLTAAEALVGYDAYGTLEALLRRVETTGEMARPVVLASILRLQARYRDRMPALPDRLRPAFEAMLDDVDPEYRRNAVRGLRFWPDDATIALLLGHAGADDGVDIEIFQTLAGYGDAFTHVLQATCDDRIPLPTAVTFVLALLAQHRIPEEEFADVARFLCVHFRAVDADTRMAVVNVAQMLAHPALHDLVREGLEDLDPTVHAFAQEAALHLGIDAAPAAVVRHLSTTVR